MTVHFKVGDLVTRTGRVCAHFDPTLFVTPGSNYRVTSVHGVAGHALKVRGSDLQWQASQFRLASLDDAYNPAPAGDGPAKVDTSGRVQWTPAPNLEDGGPLATATPPDPLNRQEGGDHYSRLPKGYQPYEIAHALGLRGPEMNVVKYTLRHGKKGDKAQGAEDIRKAIHTLQIILALDYPGL